MKKQFRLLEKINEPTDLRRLNAAELPLLAKEIRRKILQTVAKNGGHLGSSLGAVELIIALHRVFETPKDSILFDVGHQAYAHKLLTGRYSNFDTLRCGGGLSGFPRPAESPHDAFVAGHASNAISAALGIREAQYHQKQDGNVVAVVGDGSLTGGLAYEGLNMAGALPRGLIVILNDNGMFIDPTVGAMSRWLTTKLNKDSYYLVKKHVKGFLRLCPHGDEVAKLIHHAAGSSKAFFTPGILFAALGFRYLGPLDGHNIAEMEEMFRSVKERNLAEPVLIHVKTCKGRGYALAEEDPVTYHGVAPFDSLRGANYVEPQSEEKTPTYTAVFGQAMLKLGAEERRLIAITAAMKSGTGLSEFAARYPERFYDVGIAEEHAVTFAAGLAKGGMRPVVAIYSTFLQRSIDQIIHDVALPNLPVILAIDRAGLVGADGATHQGAFDIAMLRYIPNMVLMAPASDAELMAMFESALKWEKPVAIRYPRGKIYHDPAGLKEPLVFGKARIVSAGARSDVLLISYGHVFEEALKTRAILQESGIGCTLVDARFAKPLDGELLASLVVRHKLVVTIEEGAKIGGFGSAVAEFLASAALLKPLLICGLPDSFIAHDDVSAERRKCGLTGEQVAEEILRKWSIL